MNALPTPAAEPLPPRRRSRRKRVILALLAVALLAFIPVRLNSLKNRLETSMSNALGRKVTVQNISFHLLPRPGFELNNFSIEDDAAFNSEPLLRADGVDANLRLASLWGARIEIASLSLKEASLNLVRNHDGHWNLEALLTRAAQIPSAPTSLQHPETRPRFPYIEASDGRINFKFGEEKKLFAFTEADFALWLASENQWKARLTARPVRTDANLGDTGIVTASGSFQRASNLGATPFHFAAAWEKAQLGQLTHLIYGRDRGWRGAVNINAEVFGTPAKVNMTAKITITDFRRYDIASRDSVDLRANCELHYGSGSTQLDFALAQPVNSDLVCNAPIGEGELLLRGAQLADHTPAFEISAIKIPLAKVAAFARHLKRGLPEDLKVSGTLAGTIEILPQRVTGSMSASGVSLQSAFLINPIQAAGIVLAPGDYFLISAPHYKKTKAAPLPEDQSSKASIFPFTLILGPASTLTVSGRVTASEYSLRLMGESDAQRLLGLLRTFGLPPPEKLSLDSRGPTRVDLQVSGAWAGFQPPQTTGQVQFLPTANAAPG